MAQLIFNLRNHILKVYLWNISIDSHPNSSHNEPILYSIFVTFKFIYAPQNMTTKVRKWLLVLCGCVCQPHYHPRISRHP